MDLPRALLYTRNATLIGKFAKADTAKVKIAHIPAPPPATETAIFLTRGELGLLFTARND